MNIQKSIIRQARYVATAFRNQTKMPKFRPNVDGFDASGNPVGPVAFVLKRAGLESSKVVDESFDLLTKVLPKLADNDAVREAAAAVDETVDNTTDNWKRRRALASKLEALAEAIATQQ